MWRTCICGMLVQSSLPLLGNHYNDIVHRQSMNLILQYCFICDSNKAIKSFIQCLCCHKKICTYCLNKIKLISTNPKCPYCRTYYVSF